MSFYLWGFVIGFASASSIAYLDSPLNLIIAIAFIIMGAFVVLRVEGVRS